MNRKQVSFESTLEIFEHAYELGDNPSVSQGVPLTIAWKQQDVVTIDLNCYEKTRKDRRFGGQLKLPVNERVHLLLVSGYCMEDIVQCALQANQHKMARAETIKHMKWDGLHNVMERTTRKLKKVARRGSLLAAAPFIRRGSLSSSSSSTTIPSMTPSPTTSTASNHDDEDEDSINVSETTKLEWTPQSSGRNARMGSAQVSHAAANIVQAPSA